MKAAILDELGRMPRYGNFAEPHTGPSETLVDVAAAAIKPLDHAIAAGIHYSSPKVTPVICGTDGVGRDPSGALVYFTVLRRPFGAMAERAPASWTVPVPEGLDPAVAAAVVNPALAAWLPLRWRGRMQVGETVMVLGATGAAGRMAVRAARLFGAGRVVAAGRRKEVLAGLDVDARIDLTLPDVELAEALAVEVARGLDVIVDYIWGRPVEMLLPALVKNDLSAAAGVGAVRLVSVGEMAGRTIALPSGVMRGSRLEIIGSGSANFPPTSDMQAIVGEILDHATAGKLEVAINRLPLGDVERVWTSIGEIGCRSVLIIS